MHIKGVQRKIVGFFFTIHCNPSLAYIAVYETFKALNATRVYSRSYWLVIFCTTNSSRVLARERWQTFENSWKKKQYLMNTLYFMISKMLFITLCQHSMNHFLPFTKETKIYH